MQVFGERVEGVLKGGCVGKIEDEHGGVLLGRLDDSRLEGHGFGRSCGESASPMIRRGGTGVDASGAPDAAAGTRLVDTCWGHR